MHVYVAMNSVPDWSSPGPRFKSVHRTLEGAIKRLYPNGAKFTQNADLTSWTGPDGFGLIRFEIVED